MIDFKKIRVSMLGLALLALAVQLHAVDPATKARRDNLSHRMMCTCGCNELLGECSHAGCQSSTTMLHELDNYLAAGQSDEQILTAFSEKYGPTVLAAPSAKGFNLVAWITPFALLVLGLVGIILVIRRTQQRQSVALAQNGSSEASAEINKAVLKRIRRETGGEDSK